MAHAQNSCANDKSLLTHAQMEVSGYSENFALWSEGTQYQRRVVGFLRRHFRQHRPLADGVASVVSVGSGTPEMPAPTVNSTPTPTPIAIWAGYVAL